MSVRQADRQIDKDRFTERGRERARERERERKGRRNARAVLSSDQAKYIRLAGRSNAFRPSTTMPSHTN